MRSFLDAFGRELAKQIWQDLIGMSVIIALLALWERHSKRQFAAEITRLAKAAGSPK
jgi:hypothetical protein